MPNLVASSPAVSELYWGEKCLHVCMKIANLAPQLGIQLQLGHSLAREVHANGRGDARRRRRARWYPPPPRGALYVMKHVAMLALCGSGVASAGAGSGLHAVDLVEAHARQQGASSSLCQEMQQQMSPYFTDAEFVNAWLARTWADPRVYSPVNRPAMAQSARSRPQGVPRCPADTPKDLVKVRLKLQQIHGIDEKRQYYEADGSLTLRCARMLPHPMTVVSCPPP
jgi:hypothetical protein